MTRGKASLLMMLTTAVTSAMLMGGSQRNLPAVQTAVVQSGELVQSTLVSGVVSYTQLQPCVSLKDAKISAVHVTAGQRVGSGDLLFSLDTAAEEAALAALYRETYERNVLVSQAQEAVLALEDYFTLDWFEKEWTLKNAVACSDIRADHDGMVEAVYVTEGDFALQDALLGVVRGEEKCIVASAAAGVWGGMLPGTAALVFDEKMETKPAVLQSLLAPETAQQSAAFELNPQELMDWPVGHQVTVEIFRPSIPAEALIPLSAVDGAGRCWYVEDGKVGCAEVDIALCNADFAAAGMEWAGRRVILEPDQERLYEGMKVCEAVGS